MKVIVTTLAVLWIFAGYSLAGTVPGGAEGFWGQWRGPSASGVATRGNPPVTWSEGQNVRWKVEIPGSGNGTPIVWGDRVFIQTAIPIGQDVEPKEENKDDEAERKNRPPDENDHGRRRGARRDGDGNADGADAGRRGPDGSARRRSGRGFGRDREKPTREHEFTIMAFDRRSGERVWSHVVRREVPHEGSHADGSLAPGSPVTDGEHLFAYFGSRGLYCFDMQGKLLWEKDIGDMTTRNGFGEGSSPALYKDTIIANWDHEGDSFIVALDKRTGNQRWKVDRDEPTSWATPIVVEVGGAPQVVVNGSNRIRAYDISDGRVIWECGGMTLNAIPSPVVRNDLVIVMSGFRGAAIRAIRYANAGGDITDSDAVVWRYDEDTPYVPSPLLYEDHLYFFDNNRAILSCLDAGTGKPFYTRQRMEEMMGVYASPVGVQGRVYLVDRGGKTTVMKHGGKYEVLAVNSLDDGFSASPAIAGDELYLRGNKFLYCIASD